uniref:SEFIR domain-containing protein n=1 Tax=Electrophorus electricus TaxID=8005 RepID=A0AAY5EBG7_ELEEL
MCVCVCVCVCTWISFVILLGEADFGSTVMALSSATLKHNFTKRVLVPSIDTGYSLTHPLCFITHNPHFITHKTTGMAELRLDSEGSSKFRELQACQKMEAEGECFKLEWVILSVSNVSVSVMEAPTTVKASTTDRTALHWNITALCRLDVELRLCKKVSDTGCHEMKDLMNTMLHIHNRQHQNWKLYNRRWVRYYIMTRAHWSVPLLVCVVLICLTVLAAYAIQGKLKGWVLRWLKVDDISRAVGASQVVLLYPPDVDRGLAELVCGLASCLSSLGFNVSLDMWSRSELSALGPVPWLHSRLDRVQRHGGKVVLVLNQAAWARVEERGCRSVHEEREEHRGAKEANARGDASLPAPPCSDVFSASLSCILADYLQGRAGERFVNISLLPARIMGEYKQEILDICLYLPVCSYTVVCHIELCLGIVASSFFFVM